MTKISGANTNMLQDGFGVLEVSDDSHLVKEKCLNPHGGE